ncbi:MAG: hypothetical protein QM477_02635 [Planctomycetota bacterium]
MKHSFLSSFTRLAALLAVVLLCSCSRTALSPGSTGGDAGSGGGTGGSLIFTQEDLGGDWTGMLQADLIGAAPVNFYMAIFQGTVSSGAEGTGLEWDGASARFTTEFDVDGRFRTTLNSNLESGRLALSGQMDDAMVLISGTYTYSPASGATVTGTFAVTKSTGPGHFAISLLKGSWTGEAVNPSSKFRLASVEIDEAGVLISAETLDPITGKLVHSYSAGAASFVFNDDAIGRMNNVVFAADDGSFLAFRFLLINEDGSLMSGPGVDSELGSGYAIISR